MTTATINTVFTVGVITDIIIIAILLVNVIAGAKKGFVYTAYRFLRLIISFIAAYFFAKPLAEIIKTTPIHSSLSKSLEGSLSNYIDNAVSGVVHGSAENISEHIQASDSGIGALLKAFGRSPEEIAAEYSRLMEQKAETAAEDLKQFIITPVTDAITIAISFILIFAISLLVLYLVMKLLNLVAEAPVINVLNRLLGGVAGAIAAIIQIFVISIILDALLPLAGSAGIDILGQIKDSQLYSFIFSINPIALLIAITV